MNKGPEVSPLLATALICLVLGGAIGFLARDPTTRNAPTGSSNMRGGGGGGGGGGMGGAKMGGGGGMGGGGQASSATSLTRLVRNLDTVQKVQNKGLTPAQAGQIAPLLKSLLAAEKLPEAECAAKLAAIEKTLTDDQKQMLADMQPQRGGGGGMGGMGGGPPMSGGGPPMSGGGPPMSGGMGGAKMGGGGQQDPEKPFASDRNKKPLEDLITLLDHPK